MPTRPRLTKAARVIEQQQGPAQTRPQEARFLLRVDGQTKGSFDSKDAACTAGSIIKQKFPVVVVTVVDSHDGTVERVDI